MSALTRQLLESTQPPVGCLPVKVVERQVIETDWVCPHCDEIIGEKSVYCERVEGKQDENGFPVYIEYHRGCQGQIETPRTPQTGQDLAYWLQGG